MPNETKPVKEKNVASTDTKAVPVVTAVNPPVQKTKPTLPVLKPESKKDASVERDDYNPHELVIKEMMINKGVDRETALKILKNPS